MNQAGICLSWILPQWTTLLIIPLCTTVSIVFFCLFLSAFLSILSMCFFLSSRCITPFRWSQLILRIETVGHHPAFNPKLLRKDAPTDSCSYQRVIFRNIRLNCFADFPMKWLQPLFLRYWTQITYLDNRISKLAISNTGIFDIDAQSWQRQYLHEEIKMRGINYFDKISWWNSPFYRKVEDTSSWWIPSPVPKMK